MVQQLVRLGHFVDVDRSIFRAVHQARIGIHTDSGLVHTVRGTAGHVHDVVEANSLLHGQETDVFADAGYQGAHKRPNAKANVQ